MAVKADGGDTMSVAGTSTEVIVEKVGEWKGKMGLAGSTEKAAGYPKSLVKGLIAGLIGGIAAAAVKSVAEKFYPPRTHGQPEPPNVLAEKLAGHPLDNSTKEVASEAIHWGFGALAGAAYGGLAEFYPAATSKEGASFGLALASLTHGSALPVMGISARPDEQTQPEQTSEVATHVVYGLVTETVRSIVRRMLR
jgi:putative membrane protein